MEKLNPSEAQRKAMGEAACEWQGRVDTTDEYIDRIIAAANSIPEGPPVGTIARRPDGKWVAVRHRGLGKSPVWWDYNPTDYGDTNGRPGGADADSWPVIYDPDEYHEGDKPRLERLMREPSVFDADPHGTVNLDGTLPTFTPDPTAQQEPEEAPSFQCSCCRLVFWSGAKRVEVCELCIASHPITVRQWADSPKDLFDVRGGKPARTPRVVDRLGVDERGSSWRDQQGYFWHWEEDRGWLCNGGEHIPYLDWETGLYGPFREILEPRILPSLECEEARDGTVWESRNGWQFWFNGEWRTDNGTRGQDIGLLVPRLLRSGSPYTEVLPDVAS